MSTTMACKTSYEFHHHFPRLAEESGFAFNTHRPRVHIDWNKIKLIDLDNLIRERKFVLIEQHLNDILDCVFESEFDVRILDEGVMKMFRLAQLAVEYQQFCRHYLDRSVYVLREEITSLAQELDTTKKSLQDKEEELRKIKKRSRHSFKTPLPYGNDNIAAMILKTLSNKGDSMFPSSSNADTLQHNKCNYCDKVFLNQLYLQSHIARRHSEVMETPQKENQGNKQNNENAKMSAEITELRTKLKEMELAIGNSKTQDDTVVIKQTDNKVLEDKNTGLCQNKDKKTTKDAEVSTNTEEYIMNKFEQWKTEEHAKYNKEINELRTQILETINTIKEKQLPPVESRDNKIEEQLNNTIQQQGAEILKLKQELANSKKPNSKEEADKNKETEAQIALWSKRAETQSKQYEALLQKLNDVARDAKEARALAEVEKGRASQLQVLLQQSLNRKAFETVTTSTDDLVMGNHVTNHRANHMTSTELVKKSNNKTKRVTDRKTIENLHRKAQELLNLGSLSSTSSESSSAPKEEIKPESKREDKFEDSYSRTSNKSELPKTKHKNHIKISVRNDSEKFKKNKSPKENNDKSKVIVKHFKESKPTIHGSPMRVVRAKLTEEVNSRLSSFGVDPLKSRVPLNVFQKQRTELQQIQEAKIKKNPSYEKVRHSIIAFLDSNTSISSKEVNGIHEYVSPNKINGPFKSLTSVISNVKSKALSLVKMNDNNKEKRKSLNAHIAKRAMTILSTPPGSAPESPVPVNSRSPNKKRSEINYDIQQPSMKSKSRHSEVKAGTENRSIVNKPKPLNFINESDSNSEEESNEGDHKYYNTTVTVAETTKSIENLIKSPARRPASADTNMNSTSRKYTVENGELFTRTQSATNLNEAKVDVINGTNKIELYKTENSSDDIESLSDTPMKQVQSQQDIHIVKQTKSVLKNASSTSSLNKKKVLFDMDAIQMKSVSASPSQSITEKSDGNEKYELGLVNLDGEEWDISSIDNEPLKNDTKIQINTRTSPKIAELKATIESQLARRNDTPSTAIVGGVDILAGPIARAPSIGGSNTSLGSSILDESDGIPPPVSHKAFVKPKKVTEKDDSELDISEFSIDGIANKNGSF